MAGSFWNQGAGDDGFQFPTLRWPSGKVIWGVAAGVIALTLLWTGYLQIGPAEVGVMQRFGRYVRTAEPGPHLKIPFGIETLVRVTVQRQLKEEFGFRTTVAGVSSKYAQPDSKTIGRAISMWRRRVIVQYRIKDASLPVQHHDVRETFRFTSEAAMRQVVDHSVDKSSRSAGRISPGRRRNQRLCVAYGIGIEVLQLVHRDVNPPDMKPASTEPGHQEKERRSMRGPSTSCAPRRGGEQAVRAAEGYSIERENNARTQSASMPFIGSIARRPPLRANGSFETGQLRRRSADRSRRQGEGLAAPRIR